jgi:hypothetical protein
VADRSSSAAESQNPRPAPVSADWDADKTNISTSMLVHDVCVCQNSVWLSKVLTTLPCRVCQVSYNGSKTADHSDDDSESD